ncbi:hypothetical protein CEXT_581201 [Caerostris extrusa]|uniref:Uncharacterized protein n=1 Tax=Caerostris extrusa TaxID=172846 RepID=A0AAV4XFE9_CAEEX|nr:hypothetical protein CEXT_581201 [Caerostris extrusa]
MSTYIEPLAIADLQKPTKSQSSKKSSSSTADNLPLSHRSKSAIIKNLKAYTPQSSSAPLIQELESSSFEEDAVSTYIEPLAIADLQKPTKSQSPKKKIQVFYCR